MLNSSILFIRLFIFLWSIGYPFSPFFMKKLLLWCPYIVKKNADLNKKTALMPIFCQNNFYSLKNTVLSCHFFSAFSYKSPVMPIIDKKSQFCHNHGLLWTKKTKRCLFSLFLMKKSLLFSPYFFKNDPFSKKTHSSHAHILSKKSPFSQNTVLSCHFFF